jgi:multidrug transporter EmrE-like cation transporter
MKSPVSTALTIAAAVATAALANAVSAKWAKEGGGWSAWFFAMMVLSPLVFISFGLVSSKLGLAIGSGVVDSLITLSTIAIGLLLFHEARGISPLQYLGMALALAGVFLMLFFPKSVS